MPTSPCRIRARRELRWAFSSWANSLKVVGSNSNGLLRVRTTPTTVRLELRAVVVPTTTERLLVATTVGGGCPRVKTFKIFKFLWSINKSRVLSGEFCGVSHWNSKKKEKERKKRGGDRINK